MARTDVTLDAAPHEGGGHLLRTALSLSLITGKSFRLSNLRNGLTESGVTPELATAVGVCTAVCGATVSGAEVGSTELAFRPGTVRPGNYRFDLGATPITPVFQTLLWPFAVQQQPSTFVLTGVTHSPDAHAFEYLSLCWLPLVRRLGIGVTLLMPRAGFAPGGGGELRATVRGGVPLRGLRWRNPAAFDRFTGFSVQANLEEHAADQQAAGAQAVLETARIYCPMSTAALASRSPGAAITLVAGSPTGMACVTSQWDEGQSHEVVGREAADALLRQIQPRAPLDASVVEPLLLPLALAEEPSLLLVGGAVSELEATAKVIEGFLGSRISIALEAFGRVLVQVEPR